MTYEMHNYAGLPTTSTATTTTSSGRKVNKTKNAKDSRIEKYSLRQRQKRKGNQSNLDECHSYDSDYSNVEHETKMTVTLNSSPKANRYASGGGITAASAQNAAKAKPKAAPLSKYRRKTANARERTRMREINSAFETLRQCMPHNITGDETNSTNEKLTKITTLRLAMKYIRMLDEALTNPSFEANFLLECKNSGDERFITASQPTMPLRQDKSTLNGMQKYNNNHEETTKKPTAKTKANSKATAKAALPKARKSTTKRQPKRQKVLEVTSTSPFDMNLCSNGYICSSADSLSSATSITSAYASLSPNNTPTSNDASSSTLSNGSYLLDNSINSAFGTPSISDLSSLMLESDGESLHLSEHCLSPLQSQCNQLHPAKIMMSSKNSLNHFDSQDDHHSIAMTTLENPLELSLRLLESSADSMDYTLDPQAPSCISPLVTLDTFNPFGDLLQSDFPEHNSLDLFLT